MNNSYKIVLIALIDLLKEQGLAGAGEVDGLNAYQALLEVKAQAKRKLADYINDKLGIAVSPM